MIEYDLSGLPDEVVGYAFDQALEPDVLEEKWRDFSVLENVEFDYGNKTVKVYQSFIERLILAVTLEKLDDMRREVKHGERDDFDIGAIEVGMEEALDGALEIPIVTVPVLLPKRKDLAKRLVETLESRLGVIDLEEAGELYKRIEDGRGSSAPHVDGCLR